MNRAPQELIARLATPEPPPRTHRPLGGDSDTDLAEIKTGVDLRSHLEHFEGLAFNRQGKCFCPRHTETDPSFEVKKDPATGQWHWFDWHVQNQPGFSGTAIDFYVEFKGLTVGEAIRKIRELENIPEPSATKPRPTKAPDPAVYAPQAATEPSDVYEDPPGFELGQAEEAKPATTVPVAPAKPDQPAAADKQPRIKMDARPLISFQSRETHYLMQDRIPQSMFVLLSGEGGTGKSTFLSEIAARLSKGEPLPGATKALVPPGSTYYITTENQPEEVFRPRIIACKGDLAKIIYARNVLVEVAGAKGLKIFDVQAHLAALEASLDEFPDLQVLTIDPIISHTDDRMDDSRARPVRKLADTLQDLSERRKITTIGVIHHNKALATSARNKVAGSHQWVDAARVALGIAEDKKDPTGESRILSLLKSNVYVTKKSLAFKIINTTVIDPDQPELFLRAGRVEFGGDIDVDVESLFNPNKVEESMTAKAIRLLDNELRNGPRDSDEIKQLAENLGIGRGSFDAARAQMKIVSKKVGGHFGPEGEQKWQLWLPDHWAAVTRGGSR
jgi:hypothetical protein